MRYPVFDLHCDTAVELYLRRRSLYENDLQIDLKRAQSLDSYTQFFAFCCVYDETGQPLAPDAANRLFLSALENLRAELSASRAQAARVSQASFTDSAEAVGAIHESPKPADSSAKTMRATEKPDVRAIRESPLRARFRPLLSLEGPEVIDCDPARLEWLYAQGFRMTTLTWNYRNALAGSCMTGEGLTDQGREFVKEAQRLGIAIDVSHLSEKAFWDLVDITQRPIVASHSNSRACCAHVRNLTDDQFCAIRDLGGVVGMNLYAPFLNESGRATFADVQRHLDHWLSLGGAKTVALGGDLDGCDVLPEGFAGVEDYNQLGAFLSETIGEVQTLAMFAENAERFLQ